MTQVSDENTLAAVRAVLGTEPRRPSPTVVDEPSGDVDHDAERAGRRRPGAAIVGAVLVAAAVASGVFLLVTRDDDAPASTAVAPTTTAAAPVVEDPARSELGPIDGPARVDGILTAYPGELITAPDPATGEAVGWQWQVCDDDTGTPATCSPVAGADTATWQSPPTDQGQWINVVVDVEAAGRVRRLSTEPVLAAPRPVETTVVTSTTVPPPPPNAYGDPVGSAPTASSGPAGRFALALANRSAAPTEAASETLGGLARWWSLRTLGQPAPAVVATDTGYRLTAGDLEIELRDLVINSDTVTGATVCGPAGCVPVAEAVHPIGPCPPETPDCSTVRSQSNQAQIVSRYWITGIEAGPGFLYEVTGPVATISQDGAVVAFEGGVLLVQLPSQPPAGATQDVSVTYSDPMLPPDAIRITH